MGLGLRDEVVEAVNFIYNCYIHSIFGVKLLQISKPTPIFSIERYVADKAAE